MPQKREDAGEIRLRLADNIRRIRKSSGWSVVQCCTHIGVGESTWRSWENGHRSPDIDKLDDIANCLGVTTAELVS